MAKSKESVSFSSIILCLYFNLRTEITFREICIDYINRFSWEVIFKKWKNEDLQKFSFYENIRQWKLPQSNFNLNQKEV